MSSSTTMNACKQTNRTSNFFHFLFLKKTCASISVPWFHSKHPIENSAQKSPREGFTQTNFKLDEECPTDPKLDTSLADSQQWLMVLTQFYDKVNRENPLRNIPPVSKKYGIPNSHANTSYRNNSRKLSIAQLSTLQTNRNTYCNRICKQNQYTLLQRIPLLPDRWKNANAITALIITEYHLRYLSEGLKYCKQKQFVHKLPE